MFSSTPKYLLNFSPPTSSFLFNCRSRLSLPDGSLSPLAFQPRPDQSLPSIQPPSDPTEQQQSTQSPLSEIHTTFTLLQEHHFPSYEPTSAHLTSSTDGSLLLAVHCSDDQKAFIFRIFSPDMTPISTTPTSPSLVLELDAASMCSILATQPGQTCWSGGPKRYDLLVVQPDGCLVLYVDNELVTQLRIYTQQLGLNMSREEEAQGIIDYPSFFGGPDSRILQQRSAGTFF